MQRAAGGAGGRGGCEGGGSTDSGESAGDSLALYCCLLRRVLFCCVLSAALEGLGQQARERWPCSVLLVVQAAEAAVREEAAQKAVSVIGLHLE
jgi:hypothetical protein